MGCAPPATPGFLGNQIQREGTEAQKLQRTGTEAPRLNWKACGKQEVPVGTSGHVIACTGR